ncbi:hypothetical protein SK128_006831, partial [Halocaridina rubra]
MVGKDLDEAEKHVTASILPYNGSLEEAVKAVEKFAENTDSTYATLRSDPNFGQRKWNTDTFLIRWSEGEKAIGEPIPYDGVPFLLLGSRHLGCQFANEKGKRRKHVVKM